MIIKLNIILAILSLFIGLWWFCRMKKERTLPLKSNIEYLLLTGFGAYNSLAYMLTAKSDTSITQTLVELIEDFFTLLIMPILYDIIADLTKTNVSKQRLYLTFLTALIVGIINTALHITSIFYSGINVHHVYLFNIVVFIQLLWLGYAMLSDFYAYRKKIFCYYVDIQTTDFNRVHSIVGCFFFITIIAYLQLLFQRSSFDSSNVILLYSNIGFAVIIYIVGWNMSFMMGDTVVIDVASKPYTPAEVMEMTKNARMEFAEKKITNSKPPANDIPSSLAIEDIIERWTQRLDKPYLREGVSLAIAAEDMGLNVRIVSIYLNNVLHVNFNSWINALRIEEAKRILDNDNSLSVSVVAFKCGFADAPMLSKNFKKIVGMTITEYKVQKVSSNLTAKDSNL